MALSTMNTNILGCCEIDLKLNGYDYKNVRLSLLKDLCSDVITCAVSSSSIGDTCLFTNKLQKCRPITTRSRHFSVNDKAFIQSEIVKLYQKGVVEPSSTPWRAQVVVLKNPSQPDQQRLFVDYSQTINTQN